MSFRSCIVAVLLVIGACSELTSHSDEQVRLGSGFGSGLDAGIDSGPDAGAGSDAGSDAGSGGQCAEFDAVDVDFDQGDSILTSDDCQVDPCDPESSCVVASDAGIALVAGVHPMAAPEIVGSVVVVTKNGAPADVSIVLVEDAKQVASKKVEKNATDIALRTDKDIAGMKIVAIDSVNKKGYKITQGKPGMISLPDNKAKRYIEVEVTNEVDPTIIVP